MGLLSTLLTVGGTAAGAAIGGPAGAQIGASLGSAAGGALDKSGGSKKATKAQLKAIEEAKAAQLATYNDIKGYQKPGYDTYAPGVNALTRRLGVQPLAPSQPTNALTGEAGPDPRAQFRTDGAGAGVAPPGSSLNTPWVDPGATSGLKAGMGGPDPIDMTQGPDGVYSAAAPANALTAPQGGVDPGTYGDTTLGGAPAPYNALTAPGAFSFTLDDYKASPAYQWQQDQARKSILASAGATGALQSGAAVKELQDRAQNIAYLDYGKERDFAYGLSRNARGDYESDRGFGYGQSRDARSDYQDTRNYLTSRFDTGTNDLFRYTGIGQGAANQLTGAASRYGDQIAGLVTDAGTAKANNALTQGQIGADFAGDLGGTLAGLFKSGSTAAPRIFG